MKEWWQLASSASVVRRALTYAVVDHGEALLRGDLDANRAIRMALTTVVPYLVSTLSSVGAIRCKV